MSCRLNVALLLVLTPALLTNAAERTFMPDGRVRDDDYTILMARDAQRSPDLTPFQPGGHGKFHVHGWKRADQFAAWKVSAAVEADYAVNVLLRRRAGRAIGLEVSAGSQRVHGLLPSSAGGWQRVAVDGTLRLPKGQSRIELRMRSTDGNAVFDADVLSIELVRPLVRDRLHASAMKMRSDTRELQRAKYGFMVHWTSGTWPRHGDRKPYAQAVRVFDVEAFADQMKAGGAGFVVLTTSHEFQYFPAPIRSLEKILPGRTSDRDLVGELADALGRRGMKLWLYYHIGTMNDAEWTKASGFFETDTSRLFGNWCGIVSEVGHRYGDKLAGWWFDDGTVSYYYRSAPWERLARAAKAGNPQRLIGFNAWELPPATAFQDYSCGEGFADPSVGGLLPTDGDGRFPGGVYAGLQACATLVTEQDWGHWKQDSEIGRPRWTATEMSKLLSEFAAHGNVPIFNLEIYQDGTCSAASIELFRQASVMQMTRPTGAGNSIPR